MKIRGEDGKFKLGPQEDPKQCACGCGNLTTVNKGKARKFITGHNTFISNPFKGKKHNLETKKTMSEKKNGYIPWNKDKEGYQVAWNKGIPNYSARGEKSPHWKGGITPINKAIRNSFEYEEWRRKVFERDLYTCQWCGEVGGYLEADHIKPFSLFPELRFDINNGRTLCKPCHKKTDTYSWKLRWGNRKDKNI